MKQKIVIIGTGGTIAGFSADPRETSSYSVGQLSVKALIEKLGHCERPVEMVDEEFSNQLSQDISEDELILLSKRVSAWLAKDDVLGVVITHGTNTIEETAYFLHLTVHSQKPIVLTAAMRPSSALSADGPVNLLNAIDVVSHPASIAKGVMVCLNQEIHSARDVVKTNAFQVNGFSSPGLGPIGYVISNEPKFVRDVDGLHTFKSPLTLPDALPKVVIIPTFLGANGEQIEDAIRHLARGLVIEAMGAGNIPSGMIESLQVALGQSIKVLRASRSAFGILSVGGEHYEALGIVHANGLTPQKSRQLLQLVIANDRPEITPLLQAHAF